MYVTLYSSRLVFRPEEGGYYTEVRETKKSFKCQSPRRARLVLIREAKKLGLQIGKHKDWAFSMNAKGVNDYIFIETKKGKFSKYSSYC